MTKNLTITEITKDKNWFSISTKEGPGFGMEDKYDVTPKVGDKITLHCVHGSTIRGIDLNGVKVYYKSDEQLKQERKEWLANNEKENRQNLRSKKNLWMSNTINCQNVFKNALINSEPTMTGSELTTRVTKCFAVSKLL